MIELSLESQFKLAQLQQGLDDLDDDAIRVRLVATYRQIMITDNLYKAMLKKQWGVKKNG